jgi:methionine-rich copper-binding protein CopC
MSERSNLRRLPALLATLGGLVAAAIVLGGPAAPAVLGLAGLLGSTPAAGEVLANAPGEIRLVFSEAIRAASTNLDLADAAGETLASSIGMPDPADPRVLVASLATVGYARRPANGMGARDPADPGVLAVPDRTLRDGSYTVDWRAIYAANGETTSGSFSFEIRTQGGSPVAGASGPGTLALLALAGALSMGLALVAIGAGQLRRPREPR